jgi:preprotein translocase subunit SecE
VAKQSASTPEDKTVSRREAPATRARAAAPRRPATDVVGGRANRASITSFYRESVSELRKVTWPTRQETGNLTIAVIAMTVAIAAFLGVIDTSLDHLVAPLINGK